MYVVDLSLSHTHIDGLEALPASRISDIVMASSLSDEDIQQLMDVLLEKMNTNAEWQEVSDNHYLIFTFPLLSNLHLLIAHL